MSDTGDRVKEIFEQMPQRLDPDAANGLDIVIQHDLTGDGGGGYYAAIKDGSCTVTEGTHDSPSMTMTIEAADFVALLNGELDGMTAFMGGKLKIAGDMNIAMKMQTLFKG